MKQITVDMVNGVRKVRLLAPEGPQHDYHYTYATSMGGRFLAVIVADEYKDDNQSGEGRHQLRSLDAMTCGNNYEYYAADSLVGVIEKLTIEGHPVYQFRTVKEFGQWIVDNS